MGGEDFSFMLEARPGAFIFIGNGDSAGLHHPAYDFNDEAIPVGTSYWARLVETALPGVSAVYCSASRCPSNTAGWQAWPAAASAAHRRAAMLALASGPATSRSSGDPPASGLRAPR